MHKYITHTCSEITKKNSGRVVKLSGWIHRKRDHGHLLFFDLRDHFGLTQCVIENSNNFFKEVEKIKPESVVTVIGEVVNRSKETINKDLLTGDVEIRKMIEKGCSANEIWSSFQNEVKHFKEIRKEYLIYPDFE